ncbi:hypothetical protein BC332_31323 [Capsicum chinense]|nr:hypothetical protein BC332_31323 [Capsicum chinense]
MNEELALQEATAIGLKIMEHLIKLAANEPAVQVDYRKITDFAVAKLKKANSMVGQTSHARFCLGPVQAQNEVKSQAQSKVQVHDSLTSLSLSLHGYMEKERVLAPAPLSVVTPVAESVQTGLMLGFMKSRVNVVAIVGSSGGSSVGEGLPCSSSMLLHLMAQAMSAGKQPSAIGKRCREQEQSTDGSSKKRNIRNAYSRFL